jgi:hypothetical protein
MGQRIGDERLVEFALQHLGLVLRRVAEQGARPLMSAIVARPLRPVEGPVAHIDLELSDGERIFPPVPAVEHPGPPRRLSQEPGRPHARCRTEPAGRGQRPGRLAHAVGERLDAAADRGQQSGRRSKDTIFDGLRLADPVNPCEHDSRLAGIVKAAIGAQDRPVPVAKIGLRGKADLALAERIDPVAAAAKPGREVACESLAQRP